ncbi:MAG: hypothetical protein HGB08_04910 [Candidatus Moranbacteria bacterium]|nr:hypothetical protein [Candidatus Moranbacteria bacterium]
MSVSNARAYWNDYKTCQCYVKESAPVDQTDVYRPDTNKPYVDEDAEGGDCSKCDSKCNDIKSKLSEDDKKNFVALDCKEKIKDNKKTEDAKKGIPSGDGAKAGVCGNMDIFSIMEVFKCLLLYVLYFAKLVLNMAFLLFKWTIDVDSLNKVMGSSVIYQIWKIVRDMLNILFIMTLLFSAFATVLQIQSYNYKKILLNLIIMALLVNFSFPITRFIIDVSNVIMYFFVNTLLNGGSGADDLLSSSMLGPLLGNVSTKDSLLFLIAAIVFVFVFAITILVLAVLLLIRTVALSILIIFSSVAFVGSIVPGTSLAKTAHGWWSSLMEYSFFGPVMVFMVYIAAKMMTIIPKDQFRDMANATNTDSQTAIFISAATFYVIPLVILWMGMLSAKRGSVIGSSIVVSTGMKWGGRFARGAGRGGLMATSRATGTMGLGNALGEGWKNFKKNGPLFGTDIQDRKKAEWQKRLSGVKFGDKNAVRDLDRKKVNELRKEWKDNGGASDEDIQNSLKSKNKVEQMAAALEAAEKNGFKDDKRAGGLSAFEQYKKALESIKDDPAYKKLFDDKIGEKNVKFKILYDIDTNRRDASGNIMTHEQIYADHLGGMNPKKLAQQKGLHENIGTDSDLKQFMTNERANDPANYRSIFREISKENKKARDAYINNQMAP